MASQRSFTKQLPPKIAYKAKLLSQQDSEILKIRDGVFAFKDHKVNASGSVELLNTYVICKRQRLILSTNRILHDCTCEDARDEGDCFHGELSTLLWPPHLDFQCLGEQFQYCHLEKSLAAVYCEKNNTYSIIKVTGKQRKCMVCITGNTKCIHVQAYKEYCCESGNIETQNFESISKDKIAYPFTESDKQTFNSYASQKVRYPTYFIPDEMEAKCKHGYLFSNDIKALKSGAKLHLPHISLDCKVYYRPSTGDCECQLHYDGRKDLLLNLDNRNIFPYILFLDTLHNTQETRYPLHSCIRSLNRSRDIVGIDRFTPGFYEKFRIAYNCFIRLINFQFKELYHCPKCGDEPSTVVMDGLNMGCGSDLMPNPKNTRLRRVIKAKDINHRVFIRDPTTKKLLSKYSGLSSGKYKKNIEKLSDREFNKLCDLLSHHKTSLQLVIKDAGNPCPSSVRKIVGELSRESSTCGIFQITGDEHISTRLAIEEMANGNFSNMNAHITLFKKSCPMLVDFISSTDVQRTNLSSLLKDLLSSVNGPFNGAVPSDSMYREPSEIDEAHEVFPNNPMIRGAGTYDADPALETGCRKDGRTHHSLTPGLFLILCAHGICLGFQAMKHVESPQTAFDILVRRFKKIPKLIIYDNSCKLHLYCLKREPDRFINTRFMVDRLHYTKGHIGCSQGYCMDSYSEDLYIANINSQACEQANSSLRNISTQVAYMTPDNFIFHTKIFLALRNMSKIAQVLKE